MLLENKLVVTNKIKTINFKSRHFLSKEGGVKEKTTTTTVRPIRGHTQKTQHRLLFRPCTSLKAPPAGLIELQGWVTLQLAVVFLQNESEISKFQLLKCSNLQVFPFNGVKNISQI